MIFSKRAMFIFPGSHNAATRHKQRNKQHESEKSQVTDQRHVQYKPLYVHNIVLDSDYLFQEIVSSFRIPKSHAQNEKVLPMPPICLIPCHLKSNEWKAMSCGP